METIIEEKFIKFELSGIQITYIDQVLRKEAEYIISNYNPEFRKDCIVMKDGKDEQTQTCLCYLRQLKDMVEDIRIIQLPALEPEVIKFLQEEHESGGKRLDVFCKSSRLAHDDKALIGDDPSFYLFLNKISSEFSGKFNAIEIFEDYMLNKEATEKERCIEEVKESVKSAETSLESKEDKIKIVIIKTRPDIMQAFFAPFYYHKVLELIVASSGKSLEAKEHISIGTKGKMSKDSSKKMISFKCNKSLSEKERDEFFNQCESELNKDCIKVDQTHLPSQTQSEKWWYFKDDTGILIPYSKKLNNLTEKSFKKMKLSLQSNPKPRAILKVQEGSFEYIIDLSTSRLGEGTQKNTGTKKVRKIFRKDSYFSTEDKRLHHLEKELKFKPLALSFKAYPRNWTDIEKLSYKTSIYNTVKVDLSSSEAKKIFDFVKKSGSKAKILQIERIQNLAAYQKYSKEKEMIQQKYEDGERIESLLFHGTSITNPTTVISSEEGFDMRFSRQGLWGRGIYFAEKMEYSDKYAFQDSSDSSKAKQVFLAQVLTGKSCSLTSDKALIIPPTNESTLLRYDSVEGKAEGSNIHIVYENGRSYPKYLLSYSY
ncbi:unnamed protein product [Moneuplotes crassus]|uniref:Poly [ADP-ribose] polymerase n=1 Tax=Euplotes crassus TaxID=5936 RepID=A0AAD1X6K3_EUPCR|nr:unnamed protein product [Moneuplotes crassus]